MSDTDDRIQQLIAQATARREANKAKRQHLNTARQFGLTTRHQLKLSRQRVSTTTDTLRGTTEPVPPNDHDTNNPTT